jgi:hypothetical protein
MAAYENYLVDTVVLLYTFGRREKAQEFLLKARNRYPDKRFRKSLDDFAMAELAEDMAFASYNQAQATVQGYLLQACHRLAIGEYDQAVAFEGVAGKLWEKYMINIGKSTYQRRALPPYPQMKRNILKEAEKVFPAELVGRLKAEIAQKAHSSGFTLEEPAEIPAGQGADQPK